MASPTLVFAAAFSPTGLITWLLIGLVAGFFAGRTLGVMIVGPIGAFIGGLLANLLIPDAQFSYIGSIIIAIIGAYINIGILKGVGSATTSSVKRPTQSTTSAAQTLSSEAYSPKLEVVRSQPMTIPSTQPAYPTPPTVKPPFFVFVSHSSRDDAFGQMLARDLRKELGSEEAVWYDSDGGLYGGDSWWSRIVSVISMCDIFIIIISPDSMGSRWVMREFDIAFAQNKIIVPVLYRQTQIRADLQTIQYISFAGGPDSYKTALNKLLQSIRH